MPYRRFFQNGNLYHEIERCWSGLAVVMMKYLMS